MTTARFLRHNKDFTRFWFGETVSLFGVQVTNLALPLTAVLTLQVSPEELGVLRSFAFLPFLFLALPFGVLVDRRAKRPLMIYANLVRAVLVGLVPLLAVLDALTLPGLAAIVLGIGVCTVLFEVCWLSYVPVIVGQEHLVTANGRVAASSSAAEFAGPGLGGLFVQVFTAPFALVVNAFSYLVSVVSLWFVRVPEEVRPPAKRHVGKEIAEGIRFIVQQRHLRVLAVTGAAFNFCYMFVEALFVLYAVRDLHFDAGLIGVIVALGAVGGLLGAALASTLVRRFPFGRVYLLAVIVGHGGPLLIPAASGSTISTVALVIAGFFLMRGGLAVFSVAGTSLRQAVTPRELMGRMTAGMRTLMWGIGTTGAIAGGAVGGYLGLRPGLWVAALGFLLAAVPVALSRIPRLREMPSQEITTPQAAPAA
ncbi:MFS transporter [Streptoalloteichus hindustanus]|uniref:Predicted arabinose efflux permease, MFS family n=1 Tax=Streptoalloteichus hindustanus TaxID=2017 RepID=A0A1M5D0E8_STRHI|nr:MFS transporter [Streptoalloteichus hindustanus]SHF60295.1 Predicted arabinose efflux permease, MFS family [Streptoalloteichus hindustanus]